MNKADNTQLQKYRQEIDALDDELIALLRTRIAIVENVGVLKKSAGETGLYVRSGREGSMIRRIYDAFKNTAFIPAAATTMWRNIIGASIHLESPLSISVAHNENNHHFLWLAREHFGSFIPINDVTNSQRVFSDLGDDTANIGILPCPDGIDDDNWWHMLACDQGNETKIFAHLPAVTTKETPKNLSKALAIGAVMPEPSGDDQSYFSLTTTKTFSSSHMQEVFTKANLKALFLNTLTQEPYRTVLIRIDGFVDDDSDGIQTVKELLGDDLQQIFWLGAHPNPIVES